MDPNHQSPSAQQNKHKHALGQAQFNASSNRILPHAQPQPHQCEDSQHSRSQPTSVSLGMPFLVLPHHRQHAAQQRRKMLHVLIGQAGNVCTRGLPACSKKGTLPVQQCHRHQRCSIKRRHQRCSTKHRHQRCSIKHRHRLKQSNETPLLLPLLLQSHPLPQHRTRF